MMMDMIMIEYLALITNIGNNGLKFDVLQRYVCWIPQIPLPLPLPLILIYI